MGIRVVLTMLAVLAVSSCATSEARPPGPATTSTKPMLAPLSVPAEPAWSTDLGGRPGRRDARAAQLRDGMALVLGYNGFQMIDTATGATRWKVTGDTDLGGVHWNSLSSYPIFVGGAVVAPYSRGLDEEVGILLLSAEDGHVLWRSAVRVPEDSVISLWAADDQVAMVTVSDEYGRARRSEDLRMIAFDTRTGAQRWERTGTWPMAVVGDTVIGINSRTRDRPQPNVGTEVAAFDAATGTPRWDLGDRYDRSTAVLTAGDVVLAYVRKNGKEKLAVLSAATGEHVADLEAGPGVCVTDGVATIVCNELADTAQAFHLADRSTTRVPSRDLAVAVWHDRIFVKGADSYYTVDLAGNRIDERLPGEPLAVTDSYLVVADEDDVMSGFTLG